MAKIKIYCVSNHAPHEELWVDEKFVKGLLATGNYVLTLDKPKLENKRLKIGGPPLLVKRKEE